MLTRLLLAISLAIGSVAAAQDITTIRPDGTRITALYSQAEILTGAELKAANIRRDSSCRLLTRTSAGSGTLVAKHQLDNGKTVGVIMTCAHLFDPMPWEELKKANLTAHFLSDSNHSRQCQPLAVDWNNDLMALAAYVDADQPISPVRDIQDGEADFYFVGYGGQGQYQCHTGPLVGYTSMSWAGGQKKRVPANSADPYVSSGKNQIYARSSLSRGGDSGGGIINKRGELVGVFWGGSSERVYGTYSGTIKKFMGEQLPTAYRWACDPKYQQPSRQPLQQQPPMQQQPPQQQQPDLNSPLVNNPCPPQQQPPQHQPPQQPPNTSPQNNCPELQQEHQAILAALAELSGRTGKLEEGQAALLDGQNTLAEAILQLPNKKDLNDGLAALAAQNKQNLNDGLTGLGSQLADRDVQLNSALGELQASLAQGGTPAEITLQVESGRYISPSYVDVSVLWAVQQKTGIDHMVLITDTTADHWTGRMKAEYEAAKQKFPAIILFDVQAKTATKIRELPQLVIYSTDAKKPPTIVKGTDSVSKQLQTLARS